MELRGDEKRIQALFSELSREDQSIAPRFEQLWNGAQSATAVRSLNRLAWVLASLLVISASASLAIWSNYKSVPSVSPVAIITEATTPEQAKPEILVAGPRKSRRPKRHRKTEHNSLEQAALLSKWESPTAMFMASPTTLVLNSLPQLDQSANELKQFLPKNNEVTKESNQ